MREKTAGKRLLALNLALLLLLTLLPITALAAELTPGEAASYTIANNGDTHEPLTFTPSDTGFYQLSFEMPAGCEAWGVEEYDGFYSTGLDMYLFARENGQDFYAFCSVNQMSKLFYLNAGTTYEFNLTKNPKAEFDFSDEGTWTATITSVTPQTVTLDAPVDVSDSDNVSFSTFTAPEAGTYVIRTSGDKYIRLFGSDRCIISSSNNVLYKALAQGEQIYVLTSGWSGSSQVLLSVAKAMDSGTFGLDGDNLNWNWDAENFCLTISGEGSMGDIYGDLPWKPYWDMMQSVVIEPGVTDVASGAFDYCTALRNVTLPDTIERIGYGAFKDCYRLSNITIPEGITSINDYTFYNCTQLSDVTIPEGVTRIGNYAFAFCHWLKTVDFPDSLTSIGEYAFGYCNNLKNLTLPDGLTNVESNAFFDAKVPQLDIPGSLSEIGNQAFYGSNTFAVKMSEGVQHLGQESFASSGNLFLVAIPESMTAIDSSAFALCNCLTDVYYPGTEDQWNAIVIQDGNEYLTNAMIHYGEAAPETSVVDSGSCGQSVMWMLDSEGIVTIRGQGPMWDSTWDQPEFSYLTPRPESAEIGPGITSVGAYSFYHATSLGSVTIHDGVETIGKSAFGTCMNLTSVSLPASVTSIGEYAFGGCTSLADIYYEGSPAEWAAIAIGGKNDSLSKATIHYGRSGPFITAQPQSVSTVAGKTVTMTVKAVGEGLTYQWQYLKADGTWANTTLTGAKTATLKIPATVGRNGNQYRCVITDASGAELISDAATLTVFGIKTQPKDVSATAGKTVTMKVVATGENLTYQWQYQKSDGSWANTTLSGAKTDTLKISATVARNGNVYRCVVKSGNNTINSDPATLKVFGIKTQPKDVSAVAGKTVTMKVVATGENLTYQWQYQKSNGSWANTTLTGAKTDTLKIPATVARNGNVYRCVVKSGSSTVNSDGAKLTVFGIKTQPVNVSAPIGKTVTMKVVATGTNLTYQWQYQKSDGSWANTTLTGAKTSTLKIPVTAARNGNVYRCVVKSGSNTINSNGAKLTVFAIKTQPKDVTAAKGTTATMKVVATGENLTYQWQYLKSDGTWANTTLTGAKTATLSIPATAARNGNQYRCVVKSGTSTITSNAAKLTVK